jgi:hypothetical protein
MAFNFRYSDKDKSESFGTIRDPFGKIQYFKEEGNVTFYPGNKIWKSQKTEKKYPMEWYLKLGLKDPSILTMNTRSSYIKPIQAKLIDEYKQLRGNKDPSILRSKDPRIIYKAIKQRLSGVS